MLLFLHHVFKLLSFSVFKVFDIIELVTTSAEEHVNGVLPKLYNGAKGCCMIC